MPLTSELSNLPENAGPNMLSFAAEEAFLTLRADG